MLQRLPPSRALLQRAAGKCILSNVHCTCCFSVEKCVHEVDTHPERFHCNFSEQRRRVRATLQRLNGRVAMWSFAAIALAEWQSGKTALQQAVEHPVAAISFGLLISVASLAPKFAAGVSLSASLGRSSCHWRLF